MTDMERVANAIRAFEKASWWSSPTMMIVRTKAI